MLITEGEVDFASLREYRGRPPCGRSSEVVVQVVSVKNVEYQEYLIKEWEGEEEQYMVVVMVEKEVAEETGQEEVVVKLLGVVEVVSMVVEVAIVIITTITMICLNIRIGGGSNCKTLPGNTFKQTTVYGSASAQ